MHTRTISYQLADLLLASISAIEYHSRAFMPSKLRQNGYRLYIVLPGPRPHPMALYGSCIDNIFHIIPIFGQHQAHHRSFPHQTSVIKSVVFLQIVHIIQYSYYCTRQQGDAGGSEGHAFCAIRIDHPSNPLFRFIKPLCHSFISESRVLVFRRPMCEQNEPWPGLRLGQALFSSNALYERRGQQQRYSEEGVVMIVS